MIDPDPGGRPTVNLSIDVPDLNDGLRFYGTVFGMRETARPFPTMSVLDGNNVAICMHEKPSGSKSSAGSGDLRRYGRHWTPVHIDFHVADFDSTLDLVRKEGGRIERELRTGGPRPVAFCADPFGNGFCIIGPGSAPK